MPELGGWDRVPADFTRWPAGAKLDADQHAPIRAPLIDACAESRRTRGDVLRVLGAAELGVVRLRDALQGYLVSMVRVVACGPEHGTPSRATLTLLLPLRRM